jgi:hypothetical protein
MFDYAKAAFHSGTIEIALYKGKHAFKPEMRARAYRFLDEHL